MSATTAARTGMEDVLGALDPSRLGERLLSNHAVYAELHALLIDEARLLDHNRADEWLQLLADDLIYRMPVRRTVYRRQGLGFDPLMAHFDDDYLSMALRVQRLHSDSAWAEDPPSRVRRFVSNVIVHETDIAGEYAVSSYLLMLRSRYDESNYDIISAQRDDVFRRTAEGWRIARRIIYTDQSLLGTPNLAIFL